MNLVDRWFHPPRLHLPGHGVEKKAGWLELFYDLVFVAAIIQLGDHLSHNVSWKGALAFVALFLPLWSTWMSVTFYANRFNVDDARHRALVFLQMFGIGGMAVSIDQVYEGQPAQWAACYAVVRLVIVAMYARTWRHEPRAREMSQRFVLGFSLGAALWGISALLPVPWVFGVWAVALVVDMGVPLTPRARSLALRIPPDSGHMTERFGIFTIIVLGEGFVKLLAEVAKQGSSLHLVVMAGMALAITCSLWWLYFDDVAGSRIKARPLAPFIWVYSHLPFHLAVTATGVALKKAVYFDFSAPAKSPKYAVLLCVSLALAFLTVAVLDWVTVRRVSELNDRLRLGMRAGAGLLVLVLVPAVHLTPGAVFLGLVAVACVGQVLFDLAMAPQSTELMEHDHDAQHVFDVLRPQDDEELEDEEEAAATTAPPQRRDLGETVRKGTPNELRRDLYFHLMEASWTQVLVGGALAYLVFNVVFAALYLLDPSGVASLESGSFLDAFSFSVQTMATIGYGVMSPTSSWANVIVAVEAGFSMLAVALVTGIMFAKASRPRASVLFSKPIVVTVKDGLPTLMFRVGNARGNDVVEATMSMTALIETVSAEGHRFRKLHDLPLVRSRSPVFAVSWTVMHVLDDDSPLACLTHDNADECFVGIVCTLTGHDSTYAQTIHARNVYYPEDLAFGARLVDVISDLPDGRLMVDYDHFHDVVADDEVLRQLREAAEGEEAAGDSAPEV